MKIISLLASFLKNGMNPETSALNYSDAQRCAIATLSLAQRSSATTISTIPAQRMCERI